MKKPNLFLHLFLGSILKIFTLFKGQRFTKKEKIKGAAIILSNHTSFYDFMYTYSSVYPRRITFIAARKMFHEDTLKTFMKLSRAIPKSLMENDMSSVKSTLQILKKGGVVAIFPEGQISPSGATMRFNPAISKLIKKAGVNVYIAKHYGAGLVNPAWSKKTFKGKILTEKYIMLNKSDIALMNADEINNEIISHLSYLPSEFVLKSSYRYKVNDIKNLNNIIYLCSNCKHEGLEVKENKLFCPSCEHEFTYDDKGFINDIPFENYFYFQQKEVEKEILASKNFYLEADATLMSIKDDKMQVVGAGKVSLNNDYYIYEGTISGEEVKKTFDIKNVSYLPSDIGRNIQIYDQKQVYQFELTTPYLPTKFVHAGDYLYRTKQNL